LSWKNDLPLFPGLKPDCFAVAERLGGLACDLHMQLRTILGDEQPRALRVFVVGSDGRKRIPGNRDFVGRRSIVTLLKTSPESVRATWAKPPRE
jgi:hypothetical protein